MSSSTPDNNSDAISIDAMFIGVSPSERMTVDNVFSQKDFSYPTMTVNKVDASVVACSH